MEVTSQLIEETLKKSRFKKVKKIAVENFTMSAGDNSMHNSMNLEADAAMYKWNAHTIGAIREILRNVGKL